MDYISIDSSADVIEHFGIKRMKFHNSKKNEHPEHLDYEGYMKWVDNYHHLDRLGTKGAQRRRKQLIKQYRKEVGYD